MVKLLTDIEQLRVDTDQPARVVIDEATGVIVLGNDVKSEYSPIALGTLSISITETSSIPTSSAICF